MTPTEKISAIVAVFFVIIPLILRYSGRREGP